MGMGNSVDRPAYEFVDMNTAGPGAVMAAFANQVAYCAHAGTPITARVVRSTNFIAAMPLYSLGSGRGGKYETGPIVSAPSK